MTYSEIIYEKIDGIAKIWLNRPDNGNRINRKLFLGLDEAINKAAKDSEVRVVIIAAKGENFCCGFDVGDPEASLNVNEDGVVKWEDRRANTQEEIDLFLKIFNLSKPVIGVTQGRVLGGGYFLAMMCDCLIAAENTVYDNGEFALGMSYTMYTPFDAWKLPMNIAKEKAFTGLPITAEEGYRFGLFNRVVPVEKLDAAAMKLARRMLKLAPYTLTIHKEIYKMAYDLKGIQQIVPFAKETFNIGLELPGTPENQAFWQFAKDNGGDAVVELFEEKLAELAREEQEEL